MPYIHMNQPWVYMCSPSWNPLPPPSSSHPSRSSQCTSPEHPASCIKSGLVIYFTSDNIHVSMLFSQIIPPLPSPTESKSLFFTSVSLLLFRISGHHYHLSKFHIYVLIYCIDVFLELSCFFDDPADVGNLISGSSASSKTSLNIWKFTVHILLKPGWF